MKIAGAFHATRSFARRAQHGQQDRNQQCDDPNDDEKFDQSKTVKGPAEAITLPGVFYVP